MAFALALVLALALALPFVWFIWTYHCHRAASYALNTRLLQLWYTWLLLHCALCTVHCFCRHLAPFYGCSFLSLRQISGHDYQEYLLSLWHLLVFLLCSLNFENTRELQTAFSVQLYSFNLQLAILQLLVPSTVLFSVLPIPTVTRLFRPLLHLTVADKSHLCVS